MTSVSSSSAVDGLVSGLDTSSLISQLMSVDSAPQTALETSVTKAQAKVSAYQSVNTKVAALQTAVQNLQKAATWSAAAATSSSDAITASTDGTAQPGSVKVNVTKLATSQSYVSGTVSGTGDVKSGLSIPLDVVRNGTVVGTISPSSGTLSDVTAAINKATNLGISATAIRVGDNQYRLQITSNTSGTNGGFQLYPKDTYGQSGATPASQFTVLNAAQDAYAISDGFDREIADAVAVVHGRAKLRARRGHLGLGGEP